MRVQTSHITDHKALPRNPYDLSARADLTERDGRVVAQCNRRRLDHPAGNMTATAPPPTIPMDPLLDILARMDDAATVVRCAASSKPIRRAILDPAFRHVITAPRATDTTTNTNGCGFVPAFLLGFSYVHRSLSHIEDDPARVAQHGHPRPRFDAALLETFEPVAARGGLVVLRHREPPAGAGPNRRELRVCNSLTGDTTILPPPTVDDEYPPALLAVADAGRSFELLVADRSLRTQTFSTKESKWGAVVETHLPPRHCHDVPAGGGAHPVVIGAVVHWLCHGCLRPGVKVLDTTGAGNATQIALPQGYHSRVRSTQRLDTGLLLAKSADGRLGLLVAEAGAIAMWTLAAAEEEGSATARWARQVVIRREDIGREAVEGPCFSVRFMGFGERSGAVILQMDGVGLVRLDLGSKEAVVLGHGSFQHVGQTDLFQLCLHETDLCSLLQGMKPF
ncbi:unnamed protein product [Urochloa decumbens]|uniref:DUF7595 domain-containing protein n=1 Tax=Urochloa decumbens TaxID=240449 RepID=A0ABC8Y7D7_9POAL